MRSVVKSRAGECNVGLWKYENVKMVKLWNGGMQKHFHILSFHHPTISILPHSHITLIRVRLHDPPVRRREGGRGQGRLRGALALCAALLL